MNPLARLRDKQRLGRRIVVAQTNGWLLHQRG